MDTHFRLFKWLHEYSPPSSRYLVDATLAAITESVWMGLNQAYAHLDTAILFSFSLQNCSSSARLHRDQVRTGLFMSSHKFSIGLKPEPLMNIHLVDFKPFLCSFCCMFGLLSCCKIHFFTSCSSVFIHSVAVFISPFSFSSLPVPAAQKHPQSMMLPPPCFMVRMVCFCSWPNII